MAANPSLRSYMGVALETTKGTPVTATDYVPITKDSFKPVDLVTGLYDTGLRGSMAVNYNYIQGRKYATVDVAGPAFPDTIGYILASVLGDVTTTGSTAPYTHKIALKNATSGDAQPKALTLTDYYVAGTRQYPGAQFHDFTLTFNPDAQLEYTAKATCWPSATTTAPTPSFSTVTPVPVWTGTVSVGGSTIAYAMSGTLTLSRTVEPIYGISDIQGPYEVFVGGLTTTGKITFIMESDAELTRFLNNTQPAITFNFSQGTGATATQIQFQLTKGAYTTAAIDRSKDHVEVTVDINAIANTTDVGASNGYGNIVWTLQNAKASGTYQ